MTATAVNIAAEYRRRLATIKKDNGFATDIGTRIYSGWLAQAIVDDKQQTYPFLLIQPLTEKRLDKSSGGRLKLQASFQILAVERVGQGVVAKLQEHLTDLRNTLTDRNNTQQLGTYALINEVGDAEYQIPEDGFPVAWVALQVSATYQHIIN